MRTHSAAALAERFQARAGQARELSPLPRAKHVGKGRVGWLARARREDGAQVDARGDQGCGAVVERGKAGPVGDAVVAVYSPFAPADPRQQADVARACLEQRAAVCPPRALRALPDLDRHDQGLDRRVGDRGRRHRDDVEPEVELEVVDLHRRTELGRPAGRRRPPHRGVEVVPDHDLLDADDAAVSAVGGRQPGGLEHPLVVRELQQVIAALAGRDRLVADGCLERERVQAPSTWPAHRPVRLRGLTGCDGA